LRPTTNFPWKRRETPGTAANAITIKDGATLTTALQVSSQPQELRLLPSSEDASPQASGGERLSSGEVSSLPLNARDFSKLLLLAAGTMTDANGAANFTQQFAVNGQRGSPPCLPWMDSTPPIRKWAAPPSPISTWTRSRKCRPVRE